MTRPRIPIPRDIVVFYVVMLVVIAIAGVFSFPPLVP